MANQVVKFPNGNEYSADGSTSKDMLNGGHSEHFMPLVNDVVNLANDVESTAKKVASDAETVKSALQASKLAVDSATEAARSSSEAAISAEIAREAANQALNAVSDGVINDAKVSESTTFSSSKIVADFATKGDVLSALTNVAHTNRMPIVLTRGEILLANAYYSLAPENVNSIFSLPADPSDGDEIEIIDDARVWAEKLPILERNNKTINGLAEDLTLNIKGVRIFCKYRNNNWSITT